MWLKGSIHIHSNIVDGKLNPGELYKKYYSEGFNFVTITDHNKISDERKNPYNNFLIINNSTEFNNEGNLTHILGIGIRPDKIKQFIKPPVDYQKMLDYFYLNDALTIICHPDWNWISCSYNRLSLFENYHGIEIYNIIQGHDHGSSYALEKWDFLLTRRKKVWGFSVDDFHDPAKDKIGRGFLMVETDEFSETGIINALKNGKFYSSTGLLVDEFNIKDNEIFVSSLDCEEIVFKGDNGIYIKSFDANKASFKMDGNYKYVRCELRSRKGAAFLQPYFNF